MPETPPPGTGPLRLSPETVVARSRSVIASRIGDELLMMSIDQGRYFSLDPIAADVWDRLGAPRAVASLIDDLAADYDAPRSVLAEDVRRLLGEMLARDVIVLTG